MKKIIPASLILFLLFTSAKFYSQKNSSLSAVMDSLRGFDYIGAKEHADEMKTEKEKLFFMNHAKRTYKIAKYNLYPQKDQNICAKGIGNSTYQGPQPAGCSNVDFESGNTSNWTVTGDNSIVTSGTDPYGGFPKVYPGGTASLRLNDDNTSGSKTTFSAQATRVIPVTAANSQFQLHFAFVLLNFPHPANAAANFNVYFLNSSNTTVSCPIFTCYYSTPPGTLTGMPAGVAQTGANGVNIGNQVYPTTYVPWQTIAMDLTPYIGQNLTAVIRCNWCLYNYDWAYCYIDADCAPITPSTSAVCPGGQLCGPSGMYGYTWTPPSGPVVTTSCITANVVGTYTLSYTPFSSCGPSIQTNTYQVLAKPIAAFTTANSCNSFTITNTGTGPPAVQSYSFAGPSPPATFTTTSATSAISFPTPGNYTITQTITNAAGCSTTISAVVVVPAGPNPAFTIPTPTQCLVGNSYVFTAVQAATTHTYGFNPVVGSPPSSTANPYGPVSFTAPGNYTVTHTISNSGCTVSTSSVITINPMPTVTANNNGPICVGGSVSFTSSGGGTYSWSGPAGFSSAVQNPTIAAITMANAGTYTVTVNLAGCIGTATTQLTISTPTASANNTGPYCAGQTISLVGSAGLTYTWTGPSAFNSNAQSPIIANSTPAMSGNYNFTVNVGGCFATGSTPVVVNALPVPVPTNTGPYCAGATIQLNVGPFTTYTWTGPSAFTSNAQNPSVPTVTSSVANAGVYTVSVSDANGCKNTGTTNVVVNPIPTPLINSNSPICAGSALNLTSGGGTTYSWTGPNAFTSGLQNPTIASSSTINAGVYTVSVSALGCGITATTNVVVSTASANASNTGPYCAGNSIVLSTSPATGYSWAGPSGYTSAAASPTITGSTVAMSGVYSVTISIGTCTATATTNVVVNALPVPLANSNSPICDGNPLNFTGSTATTYTWTGPNSFSNNTQNPSIPTASTTASGTYTFAVTDANGCKNSVTTVVVVNANPVIVVNNPTVCLNTTINLTSNGGTGYSWSGPAAFASAAQNPNIPNAQLNMSGAYTVTVTSAQSCTNTAIANVTVLSLPSPTITNNSPVCVGGMLTLNGSGAATYQWTGPNSFNNSNQNTSISPVTMAANGTYTLLGSVGSCTANITAIIIINPLPVPNIITNSPICIGKDINLSATGGTAFVWAGPNSFSGANQTQTVTAATMVNAGTYTVVVTDANGCVNFTTANVIVNPQPVVAATGTTVCQNANAQLSSNGGVSYAWSGPGGYSSSQQNPTLFNVGSASAGQYTVFITDAKTCTNTAMATLVITPAPVPTINSNSPICINDIMNLSATGGTIYQWSGPNGFTSSVQSPTVLGSSTAVGGIYNVTVTDANSCFATATITTIVNPLPVPQITSGPNLGCAPLCVNYTVQSTPTASLAYWTMGNGESANGVLNTMSCYNTAGIYTITATVTDANGCLGQATYTAEVYPKPVADFNHAPIKPIINIDGEVVFTDASYGANILTWNWYFMNTAQYTSTQQNPTFLYTDPGTYVVALIVKSDKGCIDTLLRPLVVGEDYGLYVPNAFTPNADGFNDMFQPKGFGVVKYELYVFDRWGEKIFHTKTFEEAWDGTYQGRGNKLCEESVYTWLINVTDVFGKAHELKGHVTLIR